MMGGSTVVVPVRLEGETDALEKEGWVAAGLRRQGVWFGVGWVGVMEVWCWIGPSTVPNA